MYESLVILLIIQHSYLLYHLEILPTVLYFFLLIYLFIYYYFHLQSYSGSPFSLVYLMDKPHYV